MIKTYIWPCFHRFKFHPRVKNCWGFLEQRDIYHKRRRCIGKIERECYNKEEFERGVIEGYKTIFNTYYEKENFLNVSYTTPKLSIALNELQSRLEHSPPVLDFQSLKVHILDTNIEYGILKTNDKILGLWTPKCIKQEVMIGMIGPEFQSIWHHQPIRENINVLYRFKNRYDIWTWQRCLFTENSPWIVYNINNIIL